MGNKITYIRCYSGSLQFPCHLQLGRYGTIDLTTFSSDPRTPILEMGTVSYKVEGSSCSLVLVTHKGMDCKVCENLPRRGMQWNKPMKSVEAWGRVTETKVFLYGNANRCGLLVLELKKNNRDEDELASAVTLAHYFVYSNEASVGRRTETIDIGFSVTVKVGVSNGKFDIRVDGPEKHPVSALLFMLDEVNRTGNWKPTMCPHCDNIRKELKRMLCQSDSEDSDSVPKPPPSLGREITNSGKFVGNGNGGSIRCNNFNVHQS